MEWNGMEWKRIWLTWIWSLYGRSGDVWRWRWRCYPTLLPQPTHSYVRPVLTHVLCRVLHGSLPAHGGWHGVWRSVGATSWLHALTPCCHVDADVTSSTTTAQLWMYWYNILAIPNRTNRPMWTGISNTVVRDLQLDLLLACADTDTAGPNRAHDRPPSRTTKTATLYTNPATSWQIDVREYVNTLIVVDLSKPQID